MPIRLDTLGTLRTFRDGQELERLPAQPVRCAVLLYLAIEREAPRDTVLGMFWPESAPDQARHTLNQTLYELRRMLGDDCVDVRGDRLHISDRVEVDALEFTDAVERGDASFALGLYRGEFLGGAPPATTRAFEGWVDQWSARLGRLHRRACREAIDDRVAVEDLPAAVQLARRWTDIDPLDDEAQHRLIELLALSGDRSEALRQYERYERLVREELELEPLDETKELIEQIRTGTLNGAGPSLRGPAPPPAHEPAPLASQDGAVVPEGTAQDDARQTPVPPVAATPADAPYAGRVPDRRGLFGRFVYEIRRRHVIPWTLAYLAAALAAFEAVQNLASAYGWSPTITRELPVLLGFGAVAAIVLAWYHGAVGWQRVTPMEAGMLAILVIGAFTFATITGEGRGIQAPQPVPSLDLARIAVLPFADLSENHDLGPLAGQFTDALIDRFAHVPALHVAPRAATTPFANGETPFDSIVKTLRAGAIVEGSVKRSGGRYSVTAQLIDVTTTRTSPAQHMLSRTFTTDTGRDNAVATIADSAAGEFLSTLHDELHQRAQRARSSNTQAWKLFQRALNVEQVEAGPNQPIWTDDPTAALALLDQADSLLAQAERLDPHWLDPVVERAKLATTRATETARVGVNYEPHATRRAIAFLNQALKRDPEFVPALTERGLLRYRLAETDSLVSEADTFYHLAESDLRHAVRNDTAQAKAWATLADIDHRNSAFNAAVSDAMRALNADAFRENTPEYTFSVFFQYFSLEDRQHSDAWCNRVERLGAEATSYAAYCRLFLISAMPGVKPDVDLATRLAAEIRVSARGTDYGEIFIAKTLARAGMRDSARAVLQRAVPPPSDSLPHWAPYDAAHAWLMVGNRQKALQYLKVYVRQKPATAPSLARDWWFRPLWSNPEFQQIASGRVRG